MLHLPAELEDLYDGTTGRHLGGIYPPLLADGALTETYAGCTSTRPAQLLIYRAAVCPAPAQSLALVWMAPAGSNPLAVSPAVLPYLVQALDAGASVKLHASSDEAIIATIAAVEPMLGGWHA
jgi:hypothetical protein